MIATYEGYNYDVKMQIVADSPFLTCATARITILKKKHSPRLWSFKKKALEGGRAEKCSDFA